MKYKYNIFSQEQLLMIGVVLLISLLSLSLISAAPPITQVQQFTTGYIIQVPQDNVLKINRDYNFEFHVNNISDGHPINSLISCTFHLYNSTGRHQLEITNNVASEGLDYKFLVKGSNFTELGNSYFYYIGCNSSTLGGYRAIALEVTQTGETLTGQKIAVEVAGLFFLLLAGTLLLIFGIYSKTLIIKIFSFGLSILTIFFSLGYLINVLNVGIFDYPSLIGNMTGFYFLLSALLMVAGIGLGVFIIWFSLTAFSKTRGFRD